MIKLATELVNILKEKGLTLSCAESCTGGLVSKAITDVSGASSVFYGGVVSYDNSVKMNILGVKSATLDVYGAVSNQVAEQMAVGVREACKTDVGISTTGIAGPSGGSAEKPVGTVFIGISFNDIIFSENLRINPSYSRDEIRCETVKQLLSVLIDKIRENY